jgi:hypothetical protein
MASDESPRRRDVLRAGAAAGLLGAGWLASGATAQDTTTETDGGQGGTGVFSRSLEEGDLFRVRYRPREPFGAPATETVPAGCLDGQAEEYQVFIVRAFRGDSDVGFRGLLAPQRALAEDLLETTTAADEGMTETETEMDGGMTETEMADETTTEAAMQDDTTTAMGGETTTAMDGEGVPEIGLGDWFQVTASEPCDGMNRLTITATEAPETTPAAPEETTTE